MVRRRARGVRLLHDHGGPADREPLDSFGERGKAGALTVAGHGDHLGLDVVAHGVQIDHVITVLKRQSFGQMTAIPFSIVHATGGGGGVAGDCQPGT